MRRGMDLSINMIIIAALALLVLVVMMAIFTGNIQLLGQSSDCVSRGGECKPANECTQQRIGYSCSDENKICCIDPTKIR